MPPGSLHRWRPSSGDKPRLVAGVKSHTVLQLGTESGHTCKTGPEPRYATASGQLSGQRESRQGCQAPKSWTLTWTLCLNSKSRGSRAPAL